MGARLWDEIFSAAFAARRGIRSVGALDLSNHRHLAD